MLALFKIDNNNVRPVSCAKAYSLEDEEGSTITRHTHFRTEKEAWKSLLGQIDHDVKVYAEDAKDCGEELAQAKEELITQVLNQQAARNNYTKWTEQNRDESYPWGAEMLEPKKGQVA